ncbi:phosphate acetyltransferase [Streptosporangium sp. KLBMP 9127]|nr:phosphate acetyltransferase [Streptosporangium sp. KLBMP 9127]
MRSIYVAGLGRGAGRHVVELGLMELLSHHVERVGVYRPVSHGEQPDTSVELLRGRYRLSGFGCGLTPEELAETTQEKLVPKLADGFRAAAGGCDAMLILGGSSENDLDARLAAELGAPVVLVAGGRGRRPETVSAALRQGYEAYTGRGCSVLALIANRVAPVAAITLDLPAPCYAVPENPLLAAPTVRQAAAAVRATQVQGDDDGMQRDVLGYVFGGATLPVFLDHLRDGALVITPGDRADVLLGVLASDAAGVARPAGVMLTLGEKPSSNVRGLTARLAPELPILSAAADSFAAAALLANLEGGITPDNPKKVETALGHFAAHVDTAVLARRIEFGPSGRVTPKMFEHLLIDRAGTRRRHIVLPEGEDDRVLRAAGIIVRRGVAEVTLLGRTDEIRRRARVLGMNLDEVRVLDPLTSPLRETFAEAYALLREHKAMTHRRARDTLGDASFFGAMMVHTGMVHGMVSGVTQTTSATMRPALQILKAGPASAACFVCLPDRVLLYGDCAVNHDPDASRLADIAITTARTAERFGIEPRVAMLSYSAGVAGSGGDVDKVRRAADLVRSRAPELVVDGPIRFDSAVDPRVAAEKAPDSRVGGAATVLIFPDLDAAETASTAVRRSAGGVVLGPVLQGLRMPVNDLHRNASIADIVTMVAITAIQAQTGPV